MEVQAAVVTIEIEEELMEERDTISNLIEIMVMIGKGMTGEGKST